MIPEKIGDLSGRARYSRTMWPREGNAGLAGVSERNGFAAGSAGTGEVQFDRGPMTDYLEQKTVRDPIVT